MRIIGGGEDIPFNVVKLCEIEVLPNGAFDMNENPYLIIGYPLKDEHGDFGVVIP